MKEVEAYLTIAKSELRHPFAFLVFLTELLNVYYSGMIQTLGGEIGSLEKKLGITRGKRGFHGWNWTPDVFRSYTQECYRLSVSPIYLERRIVFLISLNKFLLCSLHTLLQEAGPNFVCDDKFTAANKTLIEVLANNLDLANCRLHQNHCLEKRLQTLMSTVRCIQVFSTIIF